MAINLKSILVSKKFLLSVLILIFLVVILLVVRQFKLTSKDNHPSELTNSTAIPLEYLSIEELNSLGADPNIKAQVISRNPLVYKIIDSPEDIVKDKKEIVNVERK